MLRITFPELISKVHFHTAQRIFLFIFLFITISTVNATTYYVDATHGNDNNDGLSPATAWRTMGKVSDFSFLPGDSILLKRGNLERTS